MNYVELVGRVLYAAIFLLASPRHFSPEGIAHATDLGVPFAALFVPASGVIMILGAVSVMSGYHTRWGAALLIVFLIPVTFSMHAFWTIHDPVAMRIQLGMFMKNVSMLGIALMLLYHGAGPVSVDGRARTPQPEV
jgi:putative oxidoreductase